MDDSLVTSLDEPEEDGLDLSFKSPPARTYAYHVHKRRSEIDQLIESEKPLFNEEEAEEKEETDLKMDTVSETHEQCLKADGKQKRATKVKLGTWDNAMKRNVSLFLNKFNLF